MKRFGYIFIILGAIAFFQKILTQSALSQIKDEQKVKTIFVPISQGNSLYTQYYTPGYYDKYGNEKISMNLSATYKLNKTINTSSIAKHLFQYDQLLFQGLSANPKEIVDVLKRDPQALVAEYFGFAPDANFNFNINPAILNQIIDIQLSISGEKLWVQVNAPITYSKWEVNDGGTPSIEGSIGTIRLQGDDDQNTFSIKSGGDTNGEMYINNNNENASTIKNLKDHWSKLDIGEYFEFDDGSTHSSGEPQAQECGMGSWGSIRVVKEKSGGRFIIPLNSSATTIIQGVQSGYTMDTYTKMSLTQDEILNTRSISRGLGGYTFGNLKDRRYNKFDFNTTDKSCIWGISDIHFKLGYNFFRHEDNHFGLYAKITIPSGTEIDKKHTEYLFRPIIGNAKHFEVGGGVSIGTVLFEDIESTIKINIDAYLTHMLKNKQFRTFDKTNMPMSRYAIVKELTKTIPADEYLDDTYAYNHVLKVLGDINCGYFDIFANIRGEGVVDIIYQNNNYEIGGGYSISGQSKELTSKHYSTGDYSSTKEYYYGFKAGTEEDDLIMMIDGKNREESLGYKDKNYYSILRFKDADDTNYVPYIKAKTNSDVGIDGTGGAYEYPTNTGDEGQNGTAAKDVFQLPQYNRSGLMDSQIIHRIFTHFDYSWEEYTFVPRVSTFGSIGFGNYGNTTLKNWEVGAKLGVSY
jgi:hypothetical protein